MRNDMLTQALCNQDFLKFALSYNGLVINAEKEKDNNELWLVIANLIEYPESMPTITYIYSVEEFTEQLLNTLENYKSKDLLLRIIKTKPSNSLLYHIWPTYIDKEPQSFTSHFSYNCLHWVAWLEDVWENQSSILSAWHSMGQGYTLGRRYAVDKSTWEFHIVISAWWLKTKDGWWSLFTPYKTIYEKRFPLQVALDYLDFRYPDKTLFDVFDVSFESLMANHKQ
jgi:hypothetical protein